MSSHRICFSRVATAVLALVAFVGLAGCGEESTVMSGTAELGDASLDPALHAMLPADVLRRGVLRIGTDASYAPMSSFAPDGRTIVGAEPDLGARIGRVLGVKVQFQNEDFTEIIPEVARGQLDLGMSAITDTEPREKEVDFVTYFSAGTAIVVQRGNPAGITDLKDLCGERVAVEDGTTQVDLLSRAQSNCTFRIDVRRFKTNSDAMVQLRTGRTVAVLNDLPPAAFLVTDPRTSAQYQLASTTQYEPGLYGVAVAKDHAALRGAVQGALQRLLENGTYEDVLLKWGVLTGKVATVTVNSGS